jgi:lysozyme family protein
MVDVTALKARNAARWHAMHIKAARLAEFKDTADKLCAADSKARYQGVTDRFTECEKLSATIRAVPWWFIAIVSEREYGGPPHWDRQLGQGDPLHEKSVNVPEGMGPYLDHPGDSTPGHDAWTRCCVDVLINSAPFAARWTDWSIGGILTLFEEYNGIGYANRGIASPYVWSGTDQYDFGKFVRDHIFDPKKADVQEGCAPLLAVMMAVDPTITTDDVAANA